MSGVPASPEMDTETRVERAAGAAPRFGRLHVGAHVATVGGSKASIPSRFETVLNTDIRENNGFGRRTYRFDDAINDVPGPGAYSKPRSIINKTQVNLSCSTKGSAAFASSTKLGGSLVPSSAFTPGPAAYDPRTELLRNAAFSAPTAAFAEPQPKPLLKVKSRARDVPGPGAYRPEAFGGEKPGGKFTTLSVREVGPITGPKTAPGPGEFAPDSYVNTFSSVGKGTHVNGRQPGSPTFSGAALKSRAEAMAALPPFFTETVPSASPLPPVVIEAAATRKEREMKQLVAHALKPLPPKPVAPSAVFAPSTQDRFGRPTVRYTASDEGLLGPGCYETEQQPRRMLISSSWALSGVDRGDRKQRWNVPGPAYYHAEQLPPRKVTHHMLSNDYWS